MNAVQTLSSVLGLAFASGVNIYLTTFALGLGIRFHWINGLPDALSMLANPLILVVSGLLFAIEFLADKIPGVSVIWDGFQTFVRPAGGAALAFLSAMNMDREWQVLALLVGGVVALSSHSTKSSYRLMLHASPEPVSNILFSFAEDFGVVGLVVLIYSHPLIALCVLLVLIAGTLMVLPVMLRVTRFLLRGFLGRVSSWFPGTGGAITPEWLEGCRELRSTVRPTLYRCFARSVGKTPRMKSGFLVFAADRHYFAYKGLFRRHVLPIGTPGVTNYLLSTGIIWDVLTIENAGTKTQTIYLPKDASKQFQVRGARADVQTQWAS
jgi:hypothetical protein